jgi:hypothetical protein
MAPSINNKFPVVDNRLVMRLVHSAPPGLAGGQRWSAARENTTTLKITQEQEEREITPQSFYETVALATFWVIPRPHVTITPFDLRWYYPQKCVRRESSEFREDVICPQISRPSIKTSPGGRSIHLWHSPRRPRHFLLTH